MEPQAELIIITGPNGAGKTSFIQSNAVLLNSYTVILPDEMPHFKEMLQQSVRAGENIVYETPFQFENFKDTLEDIKSRGYRTILYQLFLNGLKYSLERVDKRNRESRRQLSAENVEQTFTGNFYNVARYYFYFDLSFFIDYTRPPGEGTNRLIAAFEGMDLMFYRKNDLGYIRHLFRESNRLGRMNNIAFEFINNTPVVL